MAALDPPATKLAAPGDEARRQLALICLPALAIFAVCLTNRTLFSDGDTNWHVAAGRWILAHHAVPHVDPFSFTFGGKPWLADEWGAEAVFALAYAACQWSGVLLVTAFALALTLAVVAAEVTPRVGTLTAIAGSGMMIAILWPMMLARPHILALPCLALWLAGLLRARREGRIPSLWLLAVMVVWANLHGSYLLGVVFVGVFGLEAAAGAAGRRLPTLLRWAAFGLAAEAAAFLTPNGVDGLISPFRKLLMGSLSYIDEWLPERFSGLDPFQVALFLTLAVVLYRGIRMNAARTALLLALLLMALEHVRHQALLAVAAPMLLAEPFGRVMEPARLAAPVSLWRTPARETAAPFLVMAAMFVALGAWRVIDPVVRSDSSSTPITALAHVPPALRAQPVLNHYDFGGWLVLNGVKDFVDGRNDMYGDAFMKNFVAVERDADPATVSATMARWRIAWTILPPDNKLAKLLDHTAGWRRLYADKYAVVHVRDGALPGA